MPGSAEAAEEEPLCSVGVVRARGRNQRAGDPWKKSIYGVKIVAGPVVCVLREGVLANAVDIDCPVGASKAIRCKSPCQVEPTVVVQSQRSERCTAFGVGTTPCTGRFTTFKHQISAIV